MRADIHEDAGHGSPESPAPEWAHAGNAKLPMCCGSAIGLRLKDTRAGGCTGVPIDVRTECPDGCEAVLVTQVMARTSCPDPRTLRFFGSCTMSLRKDRMSSTTTRCESLLEAVPDALVGMDQKGVIRFVNSQTESLFNYDRDQLIGQPIDTLVPETLWAIYSHHQEDYFADPRTRSSGLDLELSGQRQDGREFPVNISMSRIDTGDVLLVITAVIDVAKHSQAVRKAQLIEAIVESSDVAIMSSNLKGIITSWNPAATRMYGYGSREIIGKSASVLCPEGRAGDEDVLVKIRDGQAVDVQTAGVRKDGTAVPASITVSPIRDASGSVVGTCAIHRDVTKQRQAFETAQHLAAIVESSGDAIIGSTLEGMITCWNMAAERMFGYSSQDIVGESLDLLLLEPRAGEAAADLAKIRAGQAFTAIETTRVAKDGTVFPVSVTVSPIRDTSGAIVGVSIIARNMAGQNRTRPVEGDRKTPS